MRSRNTKDTIDDGPTQADVLGANLARSVRVAMNVCIGESSTFRVGALLIESLEARVLRMLRTSRRSRPSSRVLLNQPGTELEAMSRYVTVFHEATWNQILSDQPAGSIPRRPPDELLRGALGGMQDFMHS